MRKTWIFRLAPKFEIMVTIGTSCLFGGSFWYMRKGYWNISASFLCFDIDLARWEELSEKT